MQINVRKLLDEADCREVAEYIGMDTKRKGSYIFTECANENHLEGSHLQHAVVDEKTFHCFSCGETYNAINLVIHWKEKCGEKISFTDACRVVAKSCALTLESHSTSGYKKFPLSKEEAELIGLGGNTNHTSAYEGEKIQPMSLKRLFNEDEEAFKFLIKNKSSEFAQRYKNMADILKGEYSDTAKELRRACEHNYTSCMKIYCKMEA